MDENSAEVGFVWNNATSQSQGVPSWPDSFGSGVSQQQCAPPSWPEETSATGGSSFPTPPTWWQGGGVPGGSQVLAQPSFAEGNWTGVAGQDVTQPTSGGQVLPVQADGEALARANAAMLLWQQQWAAQALAANAAASTGESGLNARVQQWPVWGDGSAWPQNQAATYQMNPVAMGFNSNGPNLLQAQMLARMLGKDPAQMIDWLAAQQTASPVASSPQKAVVQTQAAELSSVTPQASSCEDPIAAASGEEDIEDEDMAATRAAVAKFLAGDDEDEDDDEVDSTLNNAVSADPPTTHVVAQQSQAETVLQSMLGVNASDNTPSSIRSTVGSFAASPPGLTLANAPAVQAPPGLSNASSGGSGNNSNIGIDNVLPRQRDSEKSKPGNINHSMPNQKGIQDFLDVMCRRILSSEITDNLEHVKNQVYACISSLYRDRIRPVQGNVQRRLREAKCSDAIVSSVVPLCARVQDKYRILPPMKGEAPIILLHDEPQWFDGWVDPESPDDPYDEEVWEALAKFLDNEHILISNVSYLAAQELRQRALPQLRKLTLGELEHVVRLALGKRNLLTQHGDHVKPTTMKEASVKRKVATEKERWQNWQNGIFPGASALVSTATAAVPDTGDREQREMQLKQLMDRYPDGVALHRMKSAVQNICQRNLSNTELADVFKQPPFDQMFSLEKEAQRGSEPIIVVKTPKQWQDRSVPHLGNTRHQVQEKGEVIGVADGNLRKGHANMPGRCERQFVAEIAATTRGATRRMAAGAQPAPPPPTKGHGNVAPSARGGVRGSVPSVVGLREQTVS